MDPSGKALAIGGVVGTLSRFAVAGGVSGKAAIWVSIAITTVAVILFGWSAGDLNRATSFGYFSLWAEVLLVAAGSFHLIEEGQKISSDRATDRRLLPAALLAVALGAGFTLPACTHAPPSVVTAHGKAAWNADKAVQAFGDLQTVVITLNRAGDLPDATAVPIARDIKAIVTTLDTVPEGWRAATLTGWKSIRALLPANPTLQLQAAITSVDVLIAALAEVK